MYDRRIFVGLLMLGLLLAAEPLMAQQWSGGTPQAPSTSLCNIKSKTFSASGNTVEMESQACFDRQSGDTVKTWAVSDYTDDPGGSEWDSLTHSATVKTFVGAVLLGEASQTKFQTDGIACPIVWAEEFNRVTVIGIHVYEVTLQGQEVDDNTRVDE